MPPRAAPSVPVRADTDQRPVPLSHDDQAAHLVGSPVGAPQHVASGPPVVLLRDVGLPVRHSVTGPDTGDLEPAPGERGRHDRGGETLVALEKETLPVRLAHGAVTDAEYGGDVRI